jgi:hypothetical protein
MIGIIKTEALTAQASYLEGTHYKVPAGKLWRLERLTIKNDTATRGNFALMCITSGITNFLIPYTALATDTKVFDLNGLILTEIDEIYIVATGLTVGDHIYYTFRGFEKDFVGVDFTV